jgi:glutaredoxin-like protein NrdH
MITVTVYSTGPQCMRCGLTRRRLDEAGIPFTVIDLTRQENASHREFVTHELGYTEAPVVVVHDEPEHHWSGFRPDLIDRLPGSSVRGRSDHDG